MAFNFSATVVSFGAYLNCVPGFGNRMIGAHDGGGSLIKQWDLATGASISGYGLGPEPLRQGGLTLALPASERADHRPVAPD